MIKHLCVLLLVIAFSKAEFDSQEWISKYCKEEDTKLSCENVLLTTEDLGTDAVISEKDEVTIKHGDIPSLGDKFLRKFPKCTKLQLTDVDFKVEPLHKEWNIEQLVFEHCNITGIKNSNFFQSLPKLSLLGLADNNMDYKVLDKSLLGENSEMKYMVINHNDFESINEDSFDGLPNLEKLELGESQSSFPSKLFDNKPHLQSIKLSYNHLTNFPKDFLPAGLNELGLKSNQISKFSADDFKDFRSSKTLEKLYLGNNGIKKLDVGVFDELENLKVLYLDYNGLEKISKEHFQNLKHLEKLVLEGNRIKKSDIDNLGPQVDV